VPVDGRVGHFGADCVIVVPPSFDQNIDHAQRVGDIAIQQFISEPGIVALMITFLPRGLSVLSTVTQYAGLRVIKQMNDGNPPIFNGVHL
jgi:hypothetical protein